MSWGNGWGDLGGSIFGRRQGTGIPDEFWSVNLPDVPDTAPDPNTDPQGYQWWKEHQGQPHVRRVGRSGASDLLYQTNPELVWAKLLGLEAPDSNSHYARWLGNMYTEAKAKADLASINDPNVQYTDYFAQQLPGLAQRYLDLPGWQQGKSPAVSSAGRYLNL